MDSIRIITILVAEGRFTIYNLNGALVRNGIANGNTTDRLTKGFYILDLGTKCHKISLFS